MESCRVALGLRPSCALTAELHSLLVYEKGQFFLAHQDSEKRDDMVGTLVVTLPSAHQGGDLIVHAADGPTAYAGHRHELSGVALYGDLVHEVTPLHSGYRITLTYNLFRAGTEAPTHAHGPVADASTLLRRHFTSPLIARWSGDDPKPATLLVYHLDHHYTPRAMAWTRLKGRDVAAVELLREAADRADCEVALALTDVHETWNAISGDSGGYRNRWDDDSWDEDDYDDEEEDDLELDSLADSEVLITHWRPPWTTGVEEPGLRVDTRAVCAFTPSHALTPYDSDHQGYMGNYGNTIDRWYHRGAVVVWPRRLRFAVRAEVSTSWAIRDVRERLSRGERESVAADLGTVRSSWGAHLRSLGQDRTAGLADVLDIADRLEDAPLAQSLLETFAIDDLRPEHAGPLERVHDRYGETWLQTLLTEWADRIRYDHSTRDDWLVALPDLVIALRANAIATSMVELTWPGLRSRLRAALDAASTRRWRGVLSDLGRPVAGLLRAAALTDAHVVRDEILDTLRSSPSGIVAVVATLQDASSWPTADQEAAKACELAAYAQETLRARLEQPPRTLDDWSIAPPQGCDCPLCDTLASFLTDRKRVSFEWPIAEAKRAHIHGRIESAELPVTHKTRRSGRPYTLVLTKTADLFVREIDDRRDAEMTLDRLVATWR